MNYLFDYLTNTKENYGNKAAIICGEKKVTFYELYSFSLVISKEITDRGIVGKPIFIYLHKNEKVIISMMGVLASGNFYTPTDINFPIEKPKRVVQSRSNHGLRGCGAR